MSYAEIRDVLTVLFLIGISVIGAVAIVLRIRLYRDRMADLKRGRVGPKEG